MRNKKEKFNIEDFLYKPLKVQDLDTVIILYGLEEHSQHLLSAKGKPSKENTYVLHYVDVTRSLAENQIYIDSIPVNDLQTFKTNIQILDSKSEYNNLMDLGSRLTVEIAELSVQTQAYMQLFQTLRYMLGIDNPPQGKSDRSAFVVSDGQSGLAHIVFKTITGDTASLSKEDVDRMGGVIMDTIMNHVNMDTKSQEEVKKLQNELEYKLIDSLPPKMKTEDVKINIVAVLNEIRKFQGDNNDNNINEDENDEEKE